MGFCGSKPPVLLCFGICLWNPTLVTSAPAGFVHVYSCVSEAKVFQGPLVAPILFIQPAACRLQRAYLRAGQAQSPRA